MGNTVAAGVNATLDVLLNTCPNTIKPQTQIWSKLFLSVYIGVYMAYVPVITHISLG